MDEAIRYCVVNIMTPSLFSSRKSLVEQKRLKRDYANPFFWAT